MSVHRCAVIVLLCCLLLGGPVAAADTVFRMKDPRGDDRGGGQVRYPTDTSFAPGSGLFDLTQFAVTVDSEATGFHFTFAAVTNPWNAPEGFYHQRIDLFIDSVPGVGRTEPLRPGPGAVRFDAKHPWDIWLRVAPWGGTALFSHEDDPESSGRQEGIQVGVAGDGRTIEVLVPTKLLPRPLPHWRYYVLVGSFDALGVDDYRHAQPQPSRWLLQGDPELRVVDILAPRWSFGGQRRQLRLGLPEGEALLRPVGNRALWEHALLFVATTVLVTLGVWLGTRRRRT